MNGGRQRETEHVFKGRLPPAHITNNWRKFKPIQITDRQSSKFILYARSRSNSGDNKTCKYDGQTPKWEVSFSKAGL